MIGISSYVSDGGSLNSAQANALRQDGTLTVLSQNGGVDLKDHDYRLLYSRRENDRLVARIVAEKDGIIKAQIEPEDDGKDQVQAFLALRRHVEMRLDRLLQSVPGASEYQRYNDGTVTAGSSRPARVLASPPTSPVEQPIQLASQNTQPQRQNNVPTEAPPAYGKAVSEWRADGEKKR